MILKNTNETAFFDAIPTPPVSPLRKLRNYLKNFFHNKSLAKKIKRESLPQTFDKDKGFEAVPCRELYQTKLAPSIEKTIKRYQNVVTSKKNMQVSFHKKISQEQTAKKADSVLGSLAFNNDTEYRPTQQELDAFRMKAISLMKKKGLLQETISEALKAPIKVNVDEIHQDDSKHLKIKLSQRFGKLGEEFELEGIFLKRTKSQYSIPVRDSFVLNTNQREV